MYCYQHHQYNHSPQTLISYDKSARPFRVEKTFKAYRKLAVDLSNAGLQVGAIGKEETDGSTPTGGRVSEGRTSGNYTPGDLYAIDLPPFPETYFGSSLGIKLTETQLQQRCFYSYFFLFFYTCI